ncbi:nucleotide-binding universal stress UspA family protein [Amycolatopsis bartoniae]|uniref:Universal stress protein n=1 Tax=Amycolatopsis bartoniae TaxID=941986 RepID=A0A8H9IVB7_9PSEU|nr:universal stress protein [Amycolatopsis bartoniae]MBB2939289.1 nucleotide-binding universal stress UspA family protein [Amycolatopsis bartoniae]TVT08745.1 universal stress protein [Amycolatopsis bartoniae]GHF37553.1 universal stress protein [Amycolatopsis bartoniae]
MADTTARRAVLAGVDGSVSALHATRWAAREAGQRHAPLHLLHACALPPLGPHADTGTEAGLLEALVEQGHRWLRQAKAEARDTGGEVKLRTELRVGPAAAELVEESAYALVVVLGSRGLGGFRGMLAGSVSSGVCAHAHGPVVVVRGRLPGKPPPEDGPVVVGVDGSEAGDTAVAFAFEEAAHRRVPLVAVHTWVDLSVAETWSALPFDIDWGAVADDERRLLAERMAGWREKYPDVPVRQEVVRDRPVRGLLACAEEAQLIVVGSRGRHVPRGMGLGSTSQALLHHSGCPVAVVR